MRDNTALHEAAQQSARICVAFVLDPVLLRSQNMGAPIVQFFFSALERLRTELRQLGSELVLLEGAFEKELLVLARRVGAQAIFFNEDYEPSAVVRDASVQRTLEHAGFAVHQFVDHVYASADEVRSASGEPYRVFTPYKRRWLEQYRVSAKAPLPSKQVGTGKFVARCDVLESKPVPRPEDYGHRSSSDFPTGSEARALAILQSFLRTGGAAGSYGDDRNFPARNGTSHLSPHLRAGTIGIRACIAAAVRARQGRDSSQCTSIDIWISELIWRDFYQQILKNYPHVASGPFQSAAAGIRFREADSDFRAWCDARTGYPIIDAAMSQLNQYGWMHNRLRMVVASFLSKHLLLDYRRGERYFEQHLCDADRAANNGGWQWASSTGTDAAPYFRIFNPTLQSRHFDPDGTFIKSMLPALQHVPIQYVHEPWALPPLLAAQSRCDIGKDYPFPIVDHETGRTRAIATYSSALSKSRKG
ncbi:MAG: DNA photolyase family protein [Candidatus Eremiobacteraeota bacterium]|nr:DNA photolyase family protein [Candidatus Eremiobacteraeota bacterium]